MTPEILEKTNDQLIEAIADKVVEKLQAQPTALPLYLSASQVGDILGIEAKNIPNDIPRHYPGGRRNKPLFRRDQVVAFIEQKRRASPAV
jgi:hypothetical protein